MTHTLDVMQLAAEDAADKETSEGSKQIMLTEETLTDLVASRQTTQEEWHGLLAIEAAKIAKIFDAEDTKQWSIEHPSHEAHAAERELDMQGVQKATVQNIQNLLHWRQQMDDDVHRQNPAMDPSQTTYNDASCHRDVDIFHLPNVSEEIRAEVHYLGDAETSEESLMSVISILFPVATPV